MVNLLLEGAIEKGLNREMIQKALSEVKPDHVYIVVCFKEELQYYQDLGTCYLREEITQGNLTDEQWDMEECVPLEDDVFEYMNPYVIEILNQQRRFEQRYGYQISNTWENHYRIYMNNLFFWNNLLERKQITHVFFTRIPHEGYGSVLYHLCKMKHIPVMMEFASLIPNRDYALTDYMVSDVEIREEYERLQNEYADASVEEIELEGNTKEEFEKWTSLDPAKMKPSYMQGNKLRQTFRARYGETNLIRVWRGILGKEYEKYGIGPAFLGASIKKIPTLLGVIPSTYKRWNYARPYWKETKKVNAFYDRAAEQPRPGEKYIYFALHYQPEATSNPLGGGAYTDQIFPLRILCRSVPKDMKVYVKAHPAQLAFFGGISYYQEMLRMPQVRLIKMECSTYELIKNAFAVASLTGTACWESQFYGVPAILFGYSYKNASPLSYHVRTLKACKEAIESIERHEKTATLKDLKLYTKAAHNLSYHVSERSRVFPELIVKLVRENPVCKEYVKLREIAGQLDICKGDTLLISSDMKGLLFQCLEHGDETDLNVFLDSLMDAVGPEGTILIPTFNWDFCKGIPFDYCRTPCRTGSLGKVALKRTDYVRTRHPIYSFAVWGKDAVRLHEMDNRDSFGQDSPFAYLKETKAKNLFIDVSYQNSFTFAHYVEEWEGRVPYRYVKNFTAGYVDEHGREEERTYSMFVRDLDKNVHVTIDPMERQFTQDGAQKSYRINEVDFKLLDLSQAYELMKNDILYNRSRNLCTFDGQ